jgi:1-deoxyxylulose-5-phosphate synthase
MPPHEQAMMANPVITSAIPGASRPDQLTDTIAAVDLELPAALKAQMEGTTAPR